MSQIRKGRLRGRRTYVNPKMRTRRDDARAADHRSRAHRRIAQTSAASVSRVVSTTSRPARKPGFTDGFGNTMRSSSCFTV